MLIKYFKAFPNFVCKCLLKNQSSGMKIIMRLIYNNCGSFKFAVLSVCFLSKASTEKKNDYPSINVFCYIYRIIFFGYGIPSCCYRSKQLLHVQIDSATNFTIKKPKTLLN